MAKHTDTIISENGIEMKNLVVTSSTTRDDILNWIYTYYPQIDKLSYAQLLNLKIAIQVYLKKFKDYNDPYGNYNDPYYGDYDNYYSPYYK